MEKFFSVRCTFVVNCSNEYAALDIIVWLNSLNTFMFYLSFFTMHPEREGKYMLRHWMWSMTESFDDWDFICLCIYFLPKTGKVRFIREVIILVNDVRAHTKEYAAVVTNALYPTVNSRKTILFQFRITLWLYVIKMNDGSVTFLA